jgi:hypothetical protein
MHGRSGERRLKRALARLAQDEERRCASRKAGGGRELGPVTFLLLKRASASRPSGEWNDEDYDVLSDGVVKTRPPTEAASVTNRKFFDCGRRKALPTPALTKL